MCVFSSHLVPYIHQIYLTAMLPPYTQLLLAEEAPPRPFYAASIHPPQTQLARPNACDLSFSTEALLVALARFSRSLSLSKRDCRRCQQL